MDNYINYKISDDDNLRKDGMEDLLNSTNGDISRPEEEENSEQADEEKAAISRFGIKQKLSWIRKEIDDLLRIMEEDGGNKNGEKSLFSNGFLEQEALKIVEGIFDGKQMIGKDGLKYDVPPNYASKSKLVEGDVLKLRILEGGIFKYKQIEKKERIKAIGKLFYSEDQKEYFVEVPGNRKYKVLAASVTYYKAKPGDELVIIIPNDPESTWAAVENINHY